MFKLQCTEETLVLHFPPLPCVFITGTERVFNVLTNIFQAYEHHHLPTDYDDHGARFRSLGRFHGPANL